jgi:hypothetical protein
MLPSANPIKIKIYWIQVSSIRQIYRLLNVFFLLMRQQLWYCSFCWFRVLLPLTTITLFHYFILLFYLLRKNLLLKSLKSIKFFFMQDGQPLLWSLLLLGCNTTLVLIFHIWILTPMSTIYTLPSSSNQYQIK